MMPLYVQDDGTTAYETKKEKQGFMDNLKNFENFKEWAVPLKEPYKFKAGLDIEKENAMLKEKVKTLLAENSKLKHDLNDVYKHATAIVWTSLGGKNDE